MDLTMLEEVLAKKDSAIPLPPWPATASINGRPLPNTLSANSLLDESIDDAVIDQFVC